MNDSTLLTRSDQAVMAEVGDDVIFLHEKDGVYYSLTEVGALVWKTLAEPRTFADVVAVVLEQYEVSEVELRADIEQFVIQLAEKNLLVVEPGTD